MEQILNITKNYTHFDSRVTIGQRWSYITNPENIIKHKFYPLIHYVKTTAKYDKAANCIKKKERDLYYAAHLDRAVYTYYAYKTNEFYNKYIQKHNLDNVSIAYRKNKGSSIFFAKQAIDRIRRESCYIIVGDFKSFFDTLDHTYLKEQLCKIFHEDRLSKDYYAVFKNVTKYHFCDLDDLIRLSIEKNLLNKSNENIRIQEKYNKKYISQQDFNKLSRICTPQEFRTLVKGNKLIKAHEEIKGIPQGIAIASVWANVYMIKFDEIVNKNIINLDGMFMRYSDDFIMVIPKKNIKEDNLKLKYEWVCSEVAKIKLNLEPNKTRVYAYNHEQETIKNITSKILGTSLINCNDRLDYLGFTFDGKKVRLRDKAIFKYYYKLYRKINTWSRQVIDGKHRRKTNIYEIYSLKGLKNDTKIHFSKGSFIKYVNRCKQIFGEELFEEAILKRHMKKIKRRIKNDLASLRAIE